jgi:chromosome segregation ATPase
VIDSFQKEYRTYCNDIDELVVLQTYIYDLIHTYRVLYLNDTLAKFEKRIQELQKEKQEQKERQKKRELEEKQEQKERQKKRELEEKQAKEEQERIKKEKTHIQQLENKYICNYNNLSNLEETQTNIETNIQPYLEEIYNKIKIRIYDLQEEKKERDKLEEIYRKQQLEAKKKREQDEQQERQRIQVLEEAIKRERELCNCGLSLGSICKCKSPKYILIDLNKQFSCKICKNWKDRCSK